METHTNTNPEAKMASYKISRGITFSIVREAITKGFEGFWAGEVFAEFTYASDVREQVWGDFTSLEYRRVRG